MAKIYNEIIIDMNPESPTFEETLYEDSFEYSGDMMLAQGDSATIGTPIHYYKYQKWTSGDGWNDASSSDHPGSNSSIRNVEKAVKYNEYTYDEPTKAWKKTGKQIPKSTQHYANEGEANAKRVSGGSTEWGAADISKDDFINPDGTPKSIEDIYNALDTKLPNITGGELKLQIRDMLPKYTGAPEEEKGFAKEAYKKDVYGIQKEAGKAGAQMRGAYGGMGAGMRGAIGGTADISQQFRQAGQAYEKDIYELEKTAGTQFETGIGDWMQEDWFATPDTGIAKTTDFKQEGGRVPSNNKSFLEVLTELPDAGGS